MVVTECAVIFSHGYYFLTRNPNGSHVTSARLGCFPNVNQHPISREKRRVSEGNQVLSVHCGRCSQTYVRCDALHTCDATEHMRGTHTRVRHWEDPAHVCDVHARTHTADFLCCPGKTSSNAEIRQGSQRRELIIAWLTHLKSRDTKSRASRWGRGTLCMS